MAWPALLRDGWRPVAHASHAGTLQEDRPTTSLVATLWRAVEQLQTSEHDWDLAMAKARPYEALAEDTAGITARSFTTAELPVHVRTVPGRGGGGGCH